MFQKSQVCCWNVSVLLPSIRSWATYYTMFYIAIPEHRPLWKKSHNCLALWVANTHCLNGFEIVLKEPGMFLHSSLDVHVWTIDESSKEEIDDMWSHPLRRMCCGQYQAPAAVQGREGGWTVLFYTQRQYQAPSAVRGWLGDGRFYTQRPLALSQWLEDSCCWLQELRTKVTSR